MPVTPTYPGVYVQEIPSGVRTIVGAPTSIGLFIGEANAGPVNTPMFCQNFTDFIRQFGEASRPTNLGRYLRLFFLNGGTTCWVMRIAFGAASSAVTLYNENGNGSAANIALVLTAKQQGKLGDMIRAEVSYATARPESTFNVTVFQWEMTSTGTRQKRPPEVFMNLTMDPTATNYAVDVITQNSKLVDATVPAIPVAGAGYSQAGRVLKHLATAADIRAAFAARMGSTATTNRFRISVGGSEEVGVDLSVVVIPAAAATPKDTRKAIAQAIETEINTRLIAKGILTPVVVGDATAATDKTIILDPTPTATDLQSLLQISALGKDVVIRSWGPNDLAESMMLGADNGGLEVGAFAAARPAPNGLVFRATRDAPAVPNVPGSDSIYPFAEARQDSVTGITLGVGAESDPLHLIGPDTLATRGAANPMRDDNYTGSTTGRSDGVREKLGIIVSAWNASAASDSSVGWRAEQWGNYRLAFLRTPTSGDDENLVPTIVTGPNYDMGGDFTTNVRYYTLGSTGQGAFQANGVAGADGTKPTQAEYTTAFDKADTDIDQFNLMVLPPDATIPLEDGIYADASVFCAKRRAFLIMDPPASWTGIVQKADISALRVGVEKQFAAVYYPRIKARENGREVTLGPSAAIAGLYSRTDGTRGVWKAPAGVEATLRGVSALDQLFTDDNNGAMNPRAINLIRAFPNGVVSWGARTMDGDDEFGSEYKYVPIRRLALFIEETLYRALKWVVFEPNDEPLWAQIRLNVGAFMQDLFRKGAFEGKTPSQAYFVRCDGETTTPIDRDRGIVNIIVGFAPLKPAEFVIIYLQQKAAQAAA